MTSGPIAGGSDGRVACVPRVLTPLVARLRLAARERRLRSAEGSAMSVSAQYTAQHVHSSLLAPSNINANPSNPGKAEWCRFLDRSVCQYATLSHRVLVMKIDYVNGDLTFNRVPLHSFWGT